MLCSRSESIGHGHGGRALIVVGASSGVELTIGGRVILAFLGDGGEMGFTGSRSVNSIVLVEGDIGVSSLETRSTLLGRSVVVLGEITD